MSATEARVHFGELLKIVEAGGRVIVERRGRPAVIFIPPEEYYRRFPANAPGASEKIATNASKVEPE